MSSASEAAAIRKLVVVQLVMLGALAVLATAFATLILLRYDRPVQAAPAKPTQYSADFDPNLALPIPTDRKSIVIVPREGEGGMLHLPDGTSTSGGGPMVMWGPEEPADPALSAREVQRRLRSIYPWFVAVPEQGHFKVWNRDRHLLVESSNSNPYKVWLQEPDYRGGWDWRGEVERFDGRVDTGSPPTGVDDVRVAAGTVVVQTPRGFLGMRGGRTIWRRPMEGYSKPLGLAVDGDTAYLTWSEYDNRPPPKTTEEAQARYAEPEWQKGRFAAINAANGRERWVKQFRDDDFLYPPTVLKNGTVVLSTRLMPGNFEQHLLAFSKSGKELWRYTEGDDQIGLMPPVAGKDGMLYAVPTEYPGSNDLLQISPAGKLNWRATVEIIQDQTDSPYRVANDFLYLDGDIIVTGQAKSQPYLFRLDGRSGKEEWRYRLDYRPESEPLADRAGNIYCCTHNQLHAITAAGKPLWQTHTDVVSAHLHIIDGLLYVAGNMIQPYTLQGKYIEEIGIALYVPNGPGQHYCIRDDMYYRVKGGIQAVRP